MRYFAIDSTVKAGHRNIFWISRLPASISAIDECGIDLMKHLERTITNQFEITALLGRKAKHEWPDLSHSFDDV